MHYCCEILSRTFPTDKIISEVLDPFCWYKRDLSSDVKVFTWDTWQIGGRYSGSLKLKIEPDDRRYNWNFCEKRAGRLFRSKLLEAVDELGNKKPSAIYREEDMYQELGFNDGYIRVDGAYIGDLIGFEEKCIECFCLIDVDGSAYARKTWYGDHWCDDLHFEEKARDIFANGNRKDCYVAVVDLHD